MNSIEFSVKGNHLEIVKDAVSRQGSINYDSCQFSFDGEWTGFTKYAVFSAGGSDFFRIGLTDDGCVIPAGCMEKEGIVSIGVFGINNNNTVITTNTVAHYVNEGISDAGEWIEQDETLVKNAIDEFRAYAKDYTESLDERFDVLLEKVKQTGTISSQSDGVCVSGDWYVPDDFTDAENAPNISKGFQYGDFLDYKLNSLLRDYPEYVSRKSIGSDTDDENTVYSYIFEPENYEKAVFISSYVHGIDRAAFVSLCNFLDLLCRNSENDRCLGYIRENIKLVVIPVVNPYGLEHNTVANKNKVNIGSNFPFKWEKSLISNKGAAPADQKETQNVISYLQTVSKDKLCAAIDLHTSAYTVAGRTIFYPRGNKTCITALTNLVNSFNSELDSSQAASTAIFTSSVNPTMTNYIADTYKINTCELVWTNSIYSGVNSNLTVTKYTQLIVNAVCVMAKNSSFVYVPPIGPFVKTVCWNKSSDSDIFSVPQSDSLQRMNISSFSLQLNCPAAISLSGYVILSVSSECVLKIKPVLWQENLTGHNFYNRVDDGLFLQEISLTAGTHIVPISASVYGLYSCHNGDLSSLYCGKLNFVLTFASSTADSVSVTGFSVTLNAMPSELPFPVTVSKPMGIAADYSDSDMPTQTLLYPKDECSALDMNYSD